MIESITTDVPAREYDDILLDWFAKITAGQTISTRLRAWPPRLAQGLPFGCPGSHFYKQYSLY